MRHTDMLSLKELEKTNPTAYNKVQRLYKTHRWYQQQVRAHARRVEAIPHIIKRIRLNAASQKKGPGCVWETVHGWAAQVGDRPVYFRGKRARHRARTYLNSAS